MHDRTNQQRKPADPPPVDAKPSFALSQDQLSIEHSRYRAQINNFTYLHATKQHDSRRQRAFRNLEAQIAKTFKGSSPSIIRDSQSEDGGQK